MIFLLDNYIESRSGDIFLNRKNDFIKNLKQFLASNRNVYAYHFKANPKTTKNHYYKADAMAWSTIYQEKVERYAPEVYLMAEYMIKCYEYYRTLSYEEIEKGLYFFDVFRCSLDYMEKLQKINPPLSDEEFEAELDSSDKIKKFYYNYDDPDYEMPIDIEARKLINHRFDSLKAKLNAQMKKYDTMDSYDFFCEREELQEERERLEEKYIWKKKHDRDFELFKNYSLRDIQRMYKEDDTKTKPNA